MFSKLLNIGIHPALDFYQKREVRIINLFALTIIFGLLVGSTNILFLGNAYPALAEGLIAIFTITIVLLNYKQKHDAAAYTFVVIISTTLVFINQYYDISTAAYLYYFPVIFCVALLHNPKKNSSRSVIFFSIILCGFLVTKLVNISALRGTSFSAEQNRLLFLYNIYFCIILTIVLVFVFIRFLNTQYDELADLLKKTKEDQLTISNSLKEKEILLAEIQHRVKNNLSVIIGLFNFQSDLTDNAETKTALREAKNRVLSIAMVHDQLHAKDNFSKINLNSYISELIQELMRSHPVFSHAEITKNMEDLNLDISKTIPLGLIVNEVVTNSFKHAFKSHKKPALSIKLFIENGAANLVISDNGVGFPPLKDINKQSLGLSLIESLAEQIDGRVSFNNKEGAQVVVNFTLN
ncbi:MAG: sensor histidine kinase [Bacteroidota bacterium]|nr:sensor histidine kinase [Bacteroidota bacterium]